MKRKTLFTVTLLFLNMLVFGQSQSALDSLLLNLKTLDPDTAKVDCLNAISSEYRKVKNWQMAYNYAATAMDLGKELKYIKGVARAYGNTLQIYFGKSHSFELPDLVNVLYAYLYVFESIGDREGVASCHINIGNVKGGQGNSTEALNHYLSALKISEEIRDKKGMAGAYTNIGGIYRKRDNMKEALTNHSIALKLFEEVGDKRGLASCYNDIGIIYADKGQFDKALNNYFASLELKKEIGFNWGIGNTHNNIGSIYKDQGNYEEALKHHFEALKVRKEIDNHYGIAGSYNNIGSIYRDQGNYKAARQYLNDGLALSLKIRRKNRISDSYEALSELESTEGNFEQALEYYKKFKLYQDSLFNELKNKETTQMLVQFESEKKDREIALLNKENEIKALRLESQQDSLLASRLMAKNQQNEILLLNNSMEIQQLRLSETNKDLERKQAEAEMKDAQLILLNKDRELKEEQLQRQKLVRNVMIGASILMLLVGLLLYRSFRLRKKLERQQVILEERKRISADLHDDIGSGLSKIMLLSELVKHDARMPGTRKDAQKISTISQELSSNISEIIWSLNANNDYVDNLVAYIRRYAADYFDDTTVRLKVTTPDNIEQQPIQTENRRNIFYAVKEALHNIIKHAKATEVNMDLKFEKDLLSIVIQDNGVGLTTQDSNPFGNGLKNMRNRMESINGNVKIENNHGTVVTLTMPV